MGLLALGALLSSGISPRPARAKDVGLHTPGGGHIYRARETFEDVTQTSSRRVVAEVSMGAAPEGNLGFLIGVLNLPVRRLDLFAGIGLEINPSRQFTGSARYTFDIHGYRPYIAGGYVFRSLHGIGGYSHNVTLEVGYTWVIRQTLRLSAGVGVRRLLHFGLRDGSPLLEGYTDTALLQSQKDDLDTYSPVVAVRLARTF